MRNLVSIVIPAFNAEFTILDTLRSVVEQTYLDVEAVIVNDGSTDQTENVVKDFIVNHPNIRLLSTANQGLPATRNYGFLQTQGEYVVFLDADDLLDKSYVYECLEKFKRDSELSVVYTQVTFFERENGLFVLPPFSSEGILLANCITATAMIKSRLFKEVGMYDETLKFYEDWELWIRLTNKYPKVARVEKPLFFYRRRNSQNSMTDLNKQRNVSELATLYIYQKHYPLYVKNELGIVQLLHQKIEVNKYKKKYYDVWYRKLFYAFRRKKRYDN